MPAIPLSRRWIVVLAALCCIPLAWMAWQAAYQPKKVIHPPSLHDYEFGNQNLDACLISYIELLAPRLVMEAPPASTLATQLVSHEECQKRNIGHVVRIYEVNSSEYVAICHGGEGWYIDFAVVFGAYDSGIHIKGIIVTGAV